MPIPADVQNRQLRQVDEANRIRRLVECAALAVGNAGEIDRACGAPIVELLEIVVHYLEVLADDLHPTASET